MSGVCGIATFDGTLLSPGAIKAMCAAAPHRGPDGTRVWTGRGAAIAHQSLALLPPEAEALQPLARDGLVLVADARLDNRPELVSALQRSGELVGPGQQASDAQVLLAAYRRWGQGCAERLVGDFAFAVWDEERRCLFAARDPMGMRTLAYRVEPGRRVLFATEVKQLLAAPDVPARIFEPAVAADLAGHFGRPEWSFFEGIELLAPGYTLVCDTEGDSLRRFWDVDPAHEVRHADLEGYAEHLRQVFCEAVAARLRTPRAVGFLLSGGMDSGSAASVAGWLVERAAVDAPQLVACQWAFQTLPQCDERHVSRRIVERFGFHGLEVPADEGGPLACFPEHLPHPDDPMLGAYQPLIEHSLQALAQHGAGFVLGGDRGDLLIGDTGYSYLRMAQARQWGTLRSELRAHRAALDDSVRQMLRRYLLAALLGRMRRRSPREWGRWGLRKVRRRGGVATPETLPAWIRATFSSRTGLEELVAEPPHIPDGLEHSAAERYRWIFTPLHGRGMAWSERTYARYGLGFADPFSDRRLATLVLGLPQQVVNRPGDQSKPLLRAAMRGIMPEEARIQADKVVPTPLYERSLREAGTLVRELLEDSRLAANGWVDARALRDHYDGWVAGGTLRAEFWWSLGVELWLRTHWS